MGEPNERTDEALADVVYRALLQAIIAGDPRPGSRLIERELAERYEVSRVPVRHALQRLESEGFVVTEPRRGAVVRLFTRGDLEQLFDARLCIEPFATGRAARRIAQGLESPDRLAALVEQSEDRFSAGDESAGISANLRIHAEIVRLSGNDLLIRSLAPMLGRMEWVFRLTHEARDEEQAHEHERILDALVAGNAELAASLAYAHIELGRAPILAALADVLTD